MAPPSAIPPVLPPSVEEAYRRKCIQLKQRLQEVEDANLASTLRLQRMHRGIEKMRLERAFLLEQLTKRTSTNVEDSDGSPSPPPTPKEKPLRTKRGHRKPSFLNNLEDLPQPPQPSTGFGVLFPASVSPSSDTFSHSARPPAVAAATSNQSQTQGTPRASARPVTSTKDASPQSEPPKRPRNAFELYVNDQRSVLMVKHRHEIAQGTFDVDHKLAVAWRDAPTDVREGYQKRFESGDFDAPGTDVKTEENERPSNGEKHGDAEDEDVEMGEDGDDDDA